MYGEILFIWVRACAKGAFKVNFSAFSEVFESFVAYKSIPQSLLVAEETYHLTKILSMVRV